MAAQRKIPANLYLLQTHFLGFCRTLSEQPTQEAVKALCPRSRTGWSLILQGHLELQHWAHVWQFCWHDMAPRPPGLIPSPGAGAAWGLSARLHSEDKSSFPKLPGAEARTGKRGFQSLGCATVCFKKGIECLTNR